MRPSHRSPLRGSVGNGGDPRLPESPHGSRAPLALEDPGLDPFDPNDPWAGEDEKALPLGERLDVWRRKYMPLPDEVVYEFLGEDEYVVHSDHPSFRAFLTQNIAFVVLIPIIGPLFIFFLQGGITRETVLVFLILDLLVAILALKRLGDRYTSYVITNLRLIKVTGIISRKLASIPWTRMTGLGYEQKAMGRILGYATIFIESANEESGLRKFSDVNDPATFHQRLLDMVSAKSGQTGRQPPPPTTGERRKLFSSKRKDRKPLMSRPAPPSGGDGPAGGEPSGGESRGRPKVPGSGGGAPAKGRPKVGGASSTPPPDPEPADTPDAEPAAPEPTPPTQTGTPGPAKGKPKAAGRTSTATAGDPARAQREARNPPKVAGRKAERPHGRTATSHPETEAPVPGPQERTSSHGWFRWPGSGGDAKATAPPPPAAPAAPEPPPPPDAAPAPAPAPADRKPPRPKRPRRPDQRAPSKRPPQTIVVPSAERRAAAQKRRRQTGDDTRWPGKTREIEGWSES